MGERHGPHARQLRRRSGIRDTQTYIVRRSILRHLSGGSIRGSLGAHRGDAARRARPGPGLRPRRRSQGLDAGAQTGGAASHVLSSAGPSLVGTATTHGPQRYTLVGPPLARKAGQRRWRCRSQRHATSTGPTNRGARAARSWAQSCQGLLPDDRLHATDRILRLAEARAIGWLATTLGALAILWLEGEDCARPRVPEHTAGQDTPRRHERPRQHSDWRHGPRPCASMVPLRHRPSGAVHSHRWRKPPAVLLHPSHA